MPSAVSTSHDIVLVISDLDGGGAQRVLTMLADSWAEAGLRVCVITLSDAGTDRYPLHPNMTRMALGVSGDTRSVFGAAAANIRRVLELRKAIRRSAAPRVVAFVGATNVLTVLASAGLGLRVMISERNDPMRQSLGRVWDALRRLLYPFADVVTANSQGAIESLRGFVPEKKLHFLPNPVRLDEPTDRTSPREAWMLCVGRLTEQKAQDVLLQAFAMLGERAGDWRLVLVGDGPRAAELKAQADRLGVAGCVEWVGWTSEVKRYYERARIFVLPSRYEGTPNALLEAMSHGLPSVVTDASTGPLEHVRDGENGLVVPSEDAEALAGALQRLVDDVALRDRMGQAARAHIVGIQGNVGVDAWSALLGLSASAHRGSGA